MIEMMAGFLGFVVAVGLMAVGVLVGRPSIRGSCGGLARVPGIESDCEGSCTRPCSRKVARECRRRVSGAGDSTGSEDGAARHLG